MQPPERWSERSAEEGNRTLTPLRAQRPERCVSTSSTTSARCSEMVSAPAATYRSCQDAMSSYRADSSPIEGIGATGGGALKTNESCGVYRKVAGASCEISAATRAAASARSVRFGACASMSRPESRNGSTGPPDTLYPCGGRAVCLQNALTSGSGGGLQVFMGSGKSALAT